MRIALPVLLSMTLWACSASEGYDDPAEPIDRDGAPDCSPLCSTEGLCSDNFACECTLGGECFSGGYPVGQGDCCEAKWPSDCQQSEVCADRGYCYACYGMCSTSPTCEP